MKDLVQISGYCPEGLQGDLRLNVIVQGIVVLKHLVDQVVLVPEPNLEEFLGPFLFYPALESAPRYHETEFTINPWAAPVR